MSRLNPGIWLVDRAMRSRPDSSVSHLDAEALRRVQEMVIPDSGVANLVLGRPRRGVEVTTAGFEAAHGHLPLRIYRPRGAAAQAQTGGRPVVASFHGGGFALGSARQLDWSSSLVAQQLDAVVVAVDYRLAPTYPFPAAVDDTFAALVWTAEHAEELGADPERLGVMGDSAGGNLAAVATLAARDLGGARIRHQALIYPAVDLTQALADTASYAANQRGIVLSPADAELFRGWYLGEDGAVDDTDWRVSPLYADDLSGLPPAVVVVAGLDLLHDSGTAYAERLAAAGVEVTVADFPRMPHGFLSFPYLARDARRAMRAVVASQRRALRD